MAKQKLAVPTDGNIERWQRFIDKEVPLIERTSNERGLSSLRFRAIGVIKRLARPTRIAPVNPEQYEGRMTSFQNFAFEHFQVGGGVTQ